MSDEREAIVRWLLREQVVERRNGDEWAAGWNAAIRFAADTIRFAADTIERGDHLAPKE